MHSFQESSLSRRMLYFVDNKVFFKCHRSEFGETVDAKFENPDVKYLGPRSLHEAKVALDSGSQRNMTHDGGTVELFYYRQYVGNLSKYTSRALGDQGDILRAMAGIMRRDSELMGSSMLEGLPVRALEPFMLFSGRNLRRRRGFPSYSWAGWIGGIKVSIDPMFGLTLCDLVWIFWYKLTPGSPTAERVWEEDPDLAFCSDMMCENGRGISSFLFSRLGLSTSRKEPAISYLGPPLRYPILQFWTVSVFFEASNFDVFDQSTNLTGSDGTLCGDVKFDGFEETTFFDENTQFELLLISGGGSTGPEGEPSTPTSDGGQFEWLLFSGDGPLLPGTNPTEPKSYLEYFNAMVIEWMESGVAERRGSGRVEKDAIMKSLAPGPVWKEILLG